ncbi:MAG: hypothetical protein ACXV5D_04560 [Halobacteriota archaeon]
MYKAVTHHQSGMENEAHEHDEVCPATDNELRAYIYKLILAIEALDTPQVQALLQCEVPPKWHELAASIAVPFLEGTPLNDPFYRLCLDANKELAQQDEDE